MLLSGYTKCPNKRMYWSTSDDVPKILSNSMRLNRFETILRHLHFNDNSSITPEDKLYKLRPIIDHLNTTFKKHGGLEEQISIDESMIPYYGKHYAKQYIKGKPIRFGFKNWALCTSTGYCVAFEIYTGKSTNAHQFGLGGDVVISLLKKAEIGGNLGYKIFFDNYFTGIPDKKIWNKEKRGSYKFIGSKELLLVQWKDNKVVTMASNFSNINVVKTSRWCRETKSKKPIDQPEVISVYNRGMGGVDKMDGLVVVYRSRIRQRKWYWPIFAYLFDITVTNSWLLMRKLNPKDPNCVNLLKFRRYLAQSLLQKYGTPPTKGRVSTVTTDTRFDNVGHLVVYSATHRRCKQCTKKCNFICEKCNAGLHPKECFKLFHSK
ncbi:piggyBac transposable element-derived protein 3-like [Photinus pyralis]|uniref:piggyBac transposable element-derived protein 3-like n=1 Tax=Photinus pyralis TaxID=7054 RepID=UPI0012674C70|nr:piggyBac transposable element-derived protein 3-like [Photinus pyralis]